MENKKFLFQLNHPAHYHLFKHTIEELIKKKYLVRISIKDKDILEELVKDLDYIKISAGYRRKKTVWILKSLFERDKKLYKIIKEFKPDLMVGTSPEIGHMSFLTGIPSVFLGEDDINLSVTMYLGAFMCYPFFNTILSPKGVNNGIWKNKTIYYSGFQKLAYLHPNIFKPDRLKVRISTEEKFYIIRLADLNAYHDKNGSGITDAILEQIIPLLKKHGEVLISTERKIPERFTKHIFTGNIHDIHHYIYFADLLIGDSQSMAVEASMLGTPNVRFNNFAGKIQILEELEHKYNLTFGIPSSRPELLISKINQLTEKDIKDEFQLRKKQMLCQKINVAGFLTWFIENYPVSKKKIIEDPFYEERFKNLSKEYPNFQNK